MRPCIHTKLTLCGGNTEIRTVLHCEGNNKSSSDTAAVTPFTAASDTRGGGSGKWRQGAGSEPLDPILLQ